MIAHIQGRLVEKTPTEVIIECNGVGYHIPLKAILLDRDQV
jgi:Holliday junction DNA helicase RuvA